MNESNGPTHGMQLFDDAESLGTTVSEFVREGLLSNAVVLVIATPPSRDAVLAHLDPNRPGTEDHVATRSLVIGDAAESLGTLMRRGRPDEVLFEDSIGTLVRNLASRGTGLRIYGEMVELLAAEDRLREALQLEALWNELRQHVPFDLLCGYSASSFANPRDAQALGQICRSHSQVRSNPRDLLGNFLVRWHVNPIQPSSAGFPAHVERDTWRSTEERHRSE